MDCHHSLSATCQRNAGEWEEYLFFNARVKASADRHFDLGTSKQGPFDEYVY